MNIALFESAGKQKFNAGSKARQDALQIAKACGYQHITLFHNGASRLIVALDIIRGCFLAILRAGKGDRILVQYPYYPMLLNRMLFAALRAGRKIKKYRVSVLIHDLPGLRDVVCEDQRQNAKLKDELRMMRGCEIIYHNASMSSVCESVQPAAAYQVLGLFDYLYDGPICERHYEKRPVVIVSGNLSAQSTGFLYHLPSNLSLQFKLFGPNYTGASTDNVVYCGKFPSDELIRRLDGQFGLVWYGNSCDTCDGNIGEYLPYINPHKFSAYIAAGLPVIVWSKSALAGLVVTKNVGLAVESIAELEEKLQDIDEAQYQTMLQNVLSMRKDIIEGRYLGRLL